MLPVWCGCYLCGVTVQDVATDSLHLLHGDLATDHQLDKGLHDGSLHCQVGDGIEHSHAALGGEGGCLLPQWRCDLHPDCHGARHASGTLHCSVFCWILHLEQEMLSYTNTSVLCWGVGSGWADKL